MFTFPPERSNSGRGQITLHSSLGTAENRTRAVADVVKSLGEEVIPGIRNEVLTDSDSLNVVKCLYSMVLIAMHLS